MKTWILIGVAAASGIGAGFAVARVQIASSPWTRDPLRQGVVVGMENLPGGAENDPKPIVAIDGETHNFGTMDHLASKSHEFIFTNNGSAPLELTQGEKTCGCTVSESEEMTIPPGESDGFVIEWKPKDKLGKFSEGVTILTNDPKWPQVGLTIVGRVTSAYRAEPHEAVFSRITAGETATSEFRVFGYLEEPLEILECRMADPEVQDQFDVEWTPLPDDEIAGEEDATCGYLVRVTAKPGLLPGLFQQTILVRTNAKDSSQLSVSVKGFVAGEITLVGQGWDSERSTLFVGTLSGGVGAERTLLIHARGPHHEEVKFKLVEVEPSLLEVDEEALGRITRLASGKASQAMLKIRIPPDARPANHLGSDQGRLGRITIETNHPTVPRLNVYVRFAVTG